MKAISKLFVLKKLDKEANIEELKTAIDFIFIGKATEERITLKLDKQGIEALMHDLQ